MYVSDACIDLPRNNNNNNNKAYFVLYTLCHDGVSGWHALGVGGQQWSEQGFNQWGTRQRATACQHLGEWGGVCMKTARARGQTLASGVSRSVLLTSRLARGSRARCWERCGVCWAAADAEEAGRAPGRRAFGRSRGCLGFSACICVCCGAGDACRALDNVLERCLSSLSSLRRHAVLGWLVQVYAAYLRFFNAEVFSISTCQANADDHVWAVQNEQSSAVSKQSIRSSLRHDTTPIARAALCYQDAVSKHTLYSLDDHQHLDVRHTHLPTRPGWGHRQISGCCSHKNAIQQLDEPENGTGTRCAVRTASINLPQNVKQCLERLESMAPELARAGCTPANVQTISRSAATMLTVTEQCTHHAAALQALEQNYRPDINRATNFEHALSMQTAPTYALALECKHAHAHKLQPPHRDVTRLQSYNRIIGGLQTEAMQHTTGNDGDDDVMAQGDALAPNARCPVSQKPVCC